MKANLVPAKCSQPRCAAQHISAGGVNDRRPSMQPTRNVRKNVIVRCRMEFFVMIPVAITPWYSKPSRGSTSHKELPPTTVTGLDRFATISFVWRRLHVLNPVQCLVLASISAATIALPLALQPVPRTALLRNLFWPDVLNPYLTFSFVFIGILPALLGYYNLGRLGLLLSVVPGFAFAWVVTVSGLLCMIYAEHRFGSVWLGTVAFGICVLLAYVVITRLHLGAAKSRSVNDAQRKLRLIPTSQSP